MKIYRLYETGWYDDYEDDCDSRGEFFTKEALDKKVEEKTKDFVDMINERIKSIDAAYASKKQERLNLIHKAESILANAKTTNDESEKRKLKREHRKLLHQADGIKREYDNEIYSIHMNYGSTAEEMKKKALYLCGYTIEEYDVNE